ncbi:hypothetical protein [Sinorhizobium sp. BG8]|uniref:hypothetical protein n=1 Tax=Sinorhizobium sp. BG8 TaxID=2613773 RepID=UPI001FED80FC|nr:hypothetical protein [Sinorhizobium sp. BG8]
MRQRMQGRRYLLSIDPFCERPGESRRPFGKIYGVGVAEEVRHKRAIAGTACRRRQGTP